MNDLSEATKKQLIDLWTIKCTQLEMIEDRGFIIPPEELDIINMDLLDFKAYLGNVIFDGKNPVRTKLTQKYYNADGTRLLYVFYGERLGDKIQISKETVQKITSEVKDNNITDLIIIVNAQLSSDARKVLDEIKVPQHQLFDDSDLRYNPSKHVDTPHHELLTEAQTSIKLKTLRVEKHKLPNIKLLDPIVRYYGWKIGDVVRVYRDNREVSVLAPKSINYRVVVE